MEAPKGKRITPAFIQALMRDKKRKYFILVISENGAQLECRASNEGIEPSKIAIGMRRALQEMAITLLNRMSKDIARKKKSAKKRKK